MEEIGEENTGGDSQSDSDESYYTSDDDSD